MLMLGKSVAEYKNISCILYYTNIYVLLCTLGCSEKHDFSSSSLQLNQNVRLGEKIKK